MSFAQAVNTELRNTFGPKWVANAVTWAVIIGGLAMVFQIGMSTLDLSAGINSQLQNITVGQ